MDGQMVGDAEGMDAEWLPVGVTVNGERLEILVPALRRLCTMLRDDLRLTGTKVGCSVGVCGVCTVLVDGQPVSSCIMLAQQVDGRAVTTIEGLSASPMVRELQEAFITEGGFQCGFCTSGQIVSLAALEMYGRISEMRSEDICRYLQGNLCRCTGYYGIFRAVEKWRNGSSFRTPREHS